MENIDNIVCLTDENGKDMDFEFLDLIEYEDKEYVVLLPLEDSNGEVVILRIEESDEEESYCPIEDETILQAVFDLFKERFEASNKEEDELMDLFEELFEEE